MGHRRLEDLPEEVVSHCLLSKPILLLRAPHPSLSHVGLVYDTSGTQNCNYDFNVEGCNTHNSCADCFDGQFSCCLSEECVEAGQRSGSGGGGHGPGP